MDYTGSWRHQVVVQGEIGQSKVTVPSKYILLLVITMTVLGAMALVLRDGTWPAVSDPHSSCRRSSEILIRDSDSYDFGDITVRQAEALEHLFTLTNVSPHAVRIVRSSSTCGCAAVSIESDVIPSGGTVPVKVSANWANRFGPRTDKVFLWTENATDIPDISLTILGNVTSPVAVEPSLIDFGTVMPDQQITRCVSLISVDGTRVRLPDRIETRGKDVRVTMDSSGIDEEVMDIFRANYTVTLTGRRSRGAENSEVVFYYGAPDQPDSRVAVVANYPGAIRATPASVFL